MSTQAKRVGVEKGEIFEVWVSVLEEPGIRTCGLLSESGDWIGF
ncbi:hypothetical protein KS4_13310 [Poriferisphaera corsica]|uniref:Uncharacterized protein n=1 Tax=Poriferisphaera corsica TaxID=2528020 RepID=A0A517YSS7_9BACT|nr:hypothetical protein KS4_13310 [Poriferisphaera corsica]